MLFIMHKKLFALVSPALADNFANVAAGETIIPIKDVTETGKVIVDNSYPLPAMSFPDE